MKREGRERRIEAYRRASHEADELSFNGKKEECLEVLRQQLNVAAENGDEDYRLFFEAEIINNEEPYYFKQTQNIIKALEWQIEQSEKEDYFLLRTLAVYNSRVWEKDKAIELLNTALSINPEDYQSWREKGTVLTDKGELDNAIDCYNKA